MRRTAVWTLSLLVGLAGCGGAADEPAPPTTRTYEEEGVRVVESSAPLHAGVESWSLEPVPTVSIGVAEGEWPYMFSQVYGASFLPNGGILALDSSNELRIFTADGEHVRSFGRSGEGPCEFGFVVDPKVAADGTIALFDQRARRLSLMSEEGDCLASYALQIPDQAAWDLRGVFADGTLLIGAWTFPRPGESEPAAWRRLTLLRRQADPEAEAEVVVTVPWDAIVGEQQAFPARAEVAVRGDRFFVTTPDRYEIRVFERDGTEALRMRRAELPPEVTDEIVARYRDRALQNINEHAPNPEQERARLEGTVFPDHFPGYRQLIVSSEGQVWVRRHLGLPESLPSVYSLDDPTQRFERTEPIRWDVYAADGTWLAVVAGLDGAGIRAIAGDRVLTVGMDDAGIARVRLHALRQGSEES